MTDGPCPTPAFDLGWPCPAGIPAETPLNAADQLTQDCQLTVLAALESCLTPCERAAADVEDSILRDLAVRLATVEGTVEHVLAGVSDLHVATGSVPVAPIWQCLPAWAQGLLTGLSLCPAFQGAPLVPAGQLPPRTGGAGIGRDVEIGPAGRISVAPDELEQMIAVQVEAILARQAASGVMVTPPGLSSGAPPGIPVVPPVGTDAATLQGGVGGPAESGGGPAGTPAAPAPARRLLSVVELAARQPLPEPGEVDYPAEEGTPIPSDEPPPPPASAQLPPVPPPPWGVS